MTIARAKLITPWLLSIALLAVAIVSLGAVSAVAEDKSIYIFTRYQRQKETVTVWFKRKGAAKKDKRLRFELPLKLQHKQKLVDGAIVGNKCFLAALRENEPSVLEITLDPTNKRAVRVEERSADEADGRLLAGLRATNQGSGAPAGSTSTPSCLITIHSLPSGRCMPCENLKSQHPETSSTCPQIRHHLLGGLPDGNGKTLYPQVSWPGGGPKLHGMGEALTYCQRVCNPGSPGGDPNRCSDGSIATPCGDNHRCCAPLVCLDAASKKCGSPRPPTNPPTEPTDGTCEVVNGEQVCTPKDGSSDDKPTCEQQGKKTCAQASDTWCCEVNQACGATKGQCNNQNNPPSDTPLPQPTTNPGGNCSITYTCNYPDGSKGRGTVTCSPGQTSHSGSFGTLDCTSCRYSPAPNCSNTTLPPPPQNPGDVIPDPTECTNGKGC